MSNLVVLRPMTSADVEVLLAERAGEDGAGAFQWFGFLSGKRMRDRAETDELVTPDGGILAVEHDGALAGSVEWFKSGWGRPDTSWCWTIAIGLRAESRGHGVGRLAQRQVAEYLFAHTRAERVQAWTDVDNAAEQRALDAAGFQREGVIRSGQWRAGQWHDQILYSVLRSEG
jgi:RimJ/RimL family protein N-acetyltransferase